MIVSALKSWFLKQGAAHSLSDRDGQVATASVRVLPRDKAANPFLLDVPRYPPFDQGMPLITVDELLESQHELIKRIKTTCALEEHLFELLIMRVIRNYAGYIHILPATRESHYSGAGGLFRLGLEIGFYAVQSASGVVFSSRETAEMRRINQPKWVYATFLAGLCFEIYRPVTSLMVVDNDGNQWPQFIFPLHQWALSQGIDRYYIRWNESGNMMDPAQKQANAAYLLNAIIPMDCLQYMNTENAQIITSMTACITGSVRHEGAGNMIYDIVSRTHGKVLERDAKKNAQNYGRMMVGAHLEPHLIDAMRRLFASGAWTVNTKKSRIWASNEGIFLVWDSSFKEMVDVLKESNVTGIPESKNTLAEIMLRANIISPSPKGELYWDIIIPRSGRHFEAVRLAARELIFPDEFEYEHVKESLLSAGDSQAVNAPTTPPSENGVVPHSTEAAAVAGAQDSAPIPADIPKQQQSTPLTSGVANVSSSQVDSHKPSITAPTPYSIVNSGGSPENAVAAPGSELITDSLTERAKNLLLIILEDFSSGESSHPVWWCDQGLAISYDELESHGINSDALLKEAAQRDWIVRVPGKSSLIMSVQHADKSIKALVLREEVAQRIGFRKLKNTRT